MFDFCYKNIKMLMLANLKNVLAKFKVECAFK